MRTINSILLLILTVSFSPLASAVTEKSNGLPQVIKLSTTKTEIKFYKDQNGDVTDFTMPASSLIFPIAVLEEQGEYVRVKVNGKSAWVRSMNFKLERSCTDLAANNSGGKISNAVSGTRGAGGGIGCSK